MEAEFILEQEEALRRPRRQPPAFSRQPVRPLPRPPRPVRGAGPFLTSVAAQPPDSVLRPPPGCGTVLVIDDAGQALSGRHYAELMQVALLLARVRSPVSVEIVGEGDLAEEVHRLLAFLLGLAGVRYGIRVSAAQAGGAGIEIRVCVN